MENNIAIYKQNRPVYSERPPYFPTELFPEYPFKDKAIDKKNQVYASLRGLLKLLGLDLQNFGTDKWNPFGSFISPGDTVLLKPNMVKHFSEKGGIEGLITHGSLIRAVADYAYIALKGKGRIVIADGPMDDGDFGKIARSIGLYEIRKFYKDNAGFDVEIYDLRQEQVEKKGAKIVKRTRLKGDPAGYVAVDLGKMSEFKKSGLDYSLLSGAEGRQDIMSLHHNQDKDEYLISGTFLKADVVISLPKMKTHKRSGVTLGLKNLIGITGDRNWLPHFTETGVGSSKSTSPKKTLFGFLKAIFSTVRPLRDMLRQFVGVTNSTKLAGNWYGNDVIWRTIVDLMHIGLYADKNGVMRRERQRKFFVITDGIVAGEGDGPLNPVPKKCGVLVAGFNSLCSDVVSARLMGFDPMKIPKFRDMSKDMRFKIYGPDYSAIRCMSNIGDWDKDLGGIKGRCLNFKPHYGWKGHIEVNDVKK